MHTRQVNSHHFRPHCNKTVAKGSLICDCHCLEDQHEDQPTKPSGPPISPMHVAHLIITGNKSRDCMQNTLSCKIDRTLYCFERAIKISLLLCLQILFFFLHFFPKVSGQRVVILRYVQLFAPLLV